MRTGRDLIFLPNTAARYNTPEFTYVVSTNNLSFRGPDAVLDFYSPLDQFRALDDGELYYQYDGHFQPRGALECARFMSAVTRTLASDLEGSRRN